MPNVTIEVRRRYSPVEERAIIEAVHAAVTDALKVPDWDKTIRDGGHINASSGLHDWPQGQTLLEELLNTVSWRTR